MRIIISRCNREIFVSDEDFEYLSQFKWSFRASRGKRKFVIKEYAYRTLPNYGKQLLMSREITNCPRGKIVDHIDGNTFNNTRENLRITNQSGNSMNSNKSLSPRMTSIYKGVSWHKKDKAWRVRLKKDGKQIFLGNYQVEKEAALAYNEAAIKIFGDYSRINNV